MTQAKTRCIECGGSVGSLNEDEDGTPCPACAERLLETLPGIFHQPWTETASGAVDEVHPEEAHTGDSLPERPEGEGSARGRFGK